MRSGVHVVRAFNQTTEAVQSKFLEPLRAGIPFMCEGHEWEPRKTRIKVFEAPELQTQRLGMGRGWPMVEKRGTDVTLQLLESVNIGPRTRSQHMPAVSRLRERMIGRLLSGPVSLGDVISMASDIEPDATGDELEALGSQAVWETFRDGLAQLTPRDR